MIGVLISLLGSLTRRLALDPRGGVAVTYAITVLTVMVAIGSAIDLARGYGARQQLSAVATLTCQYANRGDVVKLAFGSGGSAAYISSVTAYSQAAFASQNVTWSQTTAAPFAYTTAGPGTVTLTASVPTAMMTLVGITGTPISVSLQCFALPASVPVQPVADSTNTLIVNDGFENNAYPSSVTWYLPGGQILTWQTGAAIPVVNTASANAGYVGSIGNEWIIMGYCLEVDTAGQAVSTVPEGTHHAELDCDNGSGTAGNSSISTRVYMTTGAYELRWFYYGRVPNTYYQTSYICGTTAADTSWATDTSYSLNGTTFGKQTNQINVYLDQNTTGLPPAHTTLDGTQQLAGANLIDACVYSYGWIERSVPITIATAGYYWLSFAADGAGDSFGGLIDSIRLCQGTCPGAVADNFPPTWLASAHSGVNALLFEDNFDTPSYSGAYNNTSGNLGLSYGTSAYWGENLKGWANAPQNQLPYWTAYCPQGNQCVQLGWGNNSLIAKPFLLVAGYYQINYNYVPEVLLSGYNTVYCGTTPAAASMNLPPGTYPSAAGTLRGVGSNLGNVVVDTNAVGVFMANAQLVSTPNPTSTLGATTYYTNPDKSVSTTPSVPPAGISLTLYNASQVNPLLDICGYAPSTQPRTRNVLIQKAALYWLIFAALGTADSYGGQIDDVKITALGSPSMSGPPASFITIPVPNPQPGATVSFPGFSIKADLH